MATFQVSKEYVRGQLMSMGIQNISEEDLDAYTRGKCAQIILVLVLRRVDINEDVYGTGVINN